LISEDDVYSEGNPLNGYSDFELEMLCQVHINHRHGFWTSELNGFAACYRSLTFYPKWLPMPVMSEHGLATDPSPLKTELNHKAPFFFYWSPIKKYGFRKDDRESQVLPRNIHVPCPIFYYAKKHVRRISRDLTEDHKKVLFFLPHGSPQLEVSEWPILEYVNEIKSRVGEGTQVFLCVHHHEIRKGIHKQLREFGFPLVTAGFSGNYSFASRLVNLMAHFDVTAANLFSTSAAWSCACDIPHILLRRKVTVKNYDKNLRVSDGEEFDFVWRPSHARYLHLLDRLFTDPMGVSARQKKWLSKHGLRAVSKRERLSIVMLVWFGFVRMLPYYAIKVSINVFNKILWR
jgi:hypothetical protein